MDAIKRLFYSLGLATLLGFFAILMNYPDGGFRQLDQKAQDWFQGNTFFDVLSVLGDQWVILTVSIALLLYLWLHRRNYRGMLFVFLAVGAGNALNLLLKQVFERQRPDFPQALETFSFPSNHAMVGLLYLFTLAFFITEHLAAKSVRWIVWLLTVVLTLLVGLSRVAGNEHYFSDVLAGWFAGYSWFVAVAVWYGLREYFLRKRHQNAEKG